jgi:hypothetical protein
MFSIAMILARKSAIFYQIVAGRRNANVARLPRKVVTAAAGHLPWRAHSLARRAE